MNTQNRILILASLVVAVGFAVYFFK